MHLYCWFARASTTFRFGTSSWDPGCAAVLCSSAAQFMLVVFGLCTSEMSTIGLKKFGPYNVIDWLIRRISKSMMLLYRLVGAEHDLLFNQRGAKAAHDLHLQYIPADLCYDLLTRQSGPDFSQYVIWYSTWCFRSWRCLNYQPNHINIGKVLGKSRNSWSKHYIVL
jgi:hypothetical protein